MSVFLQNYPDTKTQYVVYPLYANNTMPEQEKCKNSRLTVHQDSKFTAVTGCGTSAYWVAKQFPEAPYRQ